MLIFVIGFATIKPQLGSRGEPMVQKDFVNSEKSSDRVSLGNGLSIEVTSGGRPHATLYRRGVFVKRVDLTDNRPSKRDLPGAA